MKRKDTHDILNKTVDDKNIEIEEGFSTNKNHDLIIKIVSCALLTAMVVVLQAFSANIRFGEFSITLALIPIIIGGIFFGPIIGAVLGFIMGFIVLLLDAQAFWVINPFATIVICITKSTIAGFITGLLYKVISKISENKAIVISALICPVINTGLFALGCIVFFLETLQNWAGGTNALGYLFGTMIGINFVIEFFVISILSPSFIFIINLLKKQFK